MSASCSNTSPLDSFTSCYGSFHSEASHELAHLKNANSNKRTCCVCQMFLAISFESSLAPLENPRTELHNDNRRFTGMAKNKNDMACLDGSIKE